jgi:anaerobic dimethyl sulfoxide reductase subunit B (iron-sulfur subunit)
MTQTGFFFDQTRCTGCYTCAVACKDWNDVDAGPASWLRIQAIEKGKYPNPYLAYLFAPCYHCANPPCVLACPVDAIVRRESDGIVVVDREKCSGRDVCGSRCLNACPWDSPQFGPEDNARMQKCDLCLERREQGQQTICVEACPMYALDAGPLEDLRSERGGSGEAVGFTPSERFGPSVVFKPRTDAPS